MAHIWPSEVGKVPFPDTSGGYEDLHLLVYIFALQDFLHQYFLGTFHSRKQSTDMPPM